MTTPDAPNLDHLGKVGRNQRRDPQWDFYDIAERTAQERLRNDMRDTIADALSAMCTCTLASKTVERGRWR